MCSKNQQIVWLGLLLIVVIFLSSCGPQQTGEGERKNKEIAVSVIEVVEQKASSDNIYIGTARAAKTMVVSAPASGTISNLAIRKGDKIRKGERIAIVDSPNTNSAYKIAQATLSQAEDGYKRAKAVYDSGSISEVKMVEITTQYEQAKAAAEAASHAIEKCTLSAPFDAYVDELYVDDMQAIDILGPVCRLVNVDDVEIEFSVPENEIASIQEGETIMVQVPALGEGNLRAQVRSKGVSASPLSHSYNCIAVLERKLQNQLLPGMVCKINISPKTASSIIIPSSVVFPDTDGLYLWVVENGTAQRRRVELGGYSANGVNVLSGLEDGDLVISQGYQKVSTGTKVKVQ